MTVYSFDPLEDGRWGNFVQTHQAATIFHAPGWLEALRRTYGYEPIVFTTTPANGELGNGLVACRINSWLTGRRLVSVPFADHCEPLVASSTERHELLEHLRRVVDQERLRYVELRPLARDASSIASYATCQTFAFHRLDLRPALPELFRGLHKDGIQRKIRRAERERIEYEEGCSDPLLRSFYRLLTLTRRRHRVPPQPIEWFEQIRECLGDRLTIRVARKDGRSIASILTLRDKSTLLYKYGASDAAYHASGAMPFLFWKAIEDAKRAGLDSLDLGRSDTDNLGLIAFKDRLGANSSRLTYLRYPATTLRSRHSGYAVNMARGVVPMLPDALLIGLGKLLYRHIG